MSRGSFALSIVTALILMSGSAMHAAWISIYDFEDSGTDYSVVTTASSDSLEDLYLYGYGNGPLTSHGAISSALTLENGVPVAHDVQVHLTFAMLGTVSGYGPLTNPGFIRMLYPNANPNQMDYRLLSSGYIGSIVEGVEIDFSESVDSSLGFVVKAVAVPEPSSCALLGLGFLGVSVMRRRFVA
ncbi:PEP-CTERM sorting domain-containing protein [Myxococcota bacterium]|nr:PEP-CTERM sorting domain-containing protein [Myxococcota bacterium]